MMYLVLTQSHPDPTALIAMGTMIGLPTFFWLDPSSGFNHQDQNKPSPPPSRREER